MSPFLGGLHSNTNLRCTRGVAEFIVFLLHIQDQAIRVSFLRVACVCKYHLTQIDCSIYFYTLVFVKVMDDGGGDCVTFLGSTRPAGIKPVRASVLNEAMRWRFEGRTDGDENAAPPTNSDASRIDAKNVLKQMYSLKGSPHTYAGTQGSVKFWLPPVGVYFEDNTFACYRSHLPSSKCKSSQRCSRYSKKNDSFTGNPIFCFELLYLAKCSLLSAPIEICFIGDVYTLLVRDASQKLLLGHISPENGDANAWCQQRPFSM